MSKAPKKGKPTRLFRRIIGVLVGIALGGTGALWWVMVRMPGQSHQGPLPALSEAEQTLAKQLRSDVVMLASEIGERNADHPEALEKAGQFVARRLSSAGYQVERYSFEALGQTFHNFEATLPGATLPGEVVVIGAHYDAAEGAPAANDNGTGTAALFAIAEALKDARLARTVRFVAFTNEEPPHFKNPAMGSRHYARLCKKRGDVVTAMLSLETMGYYRDEAGSQRYPFPLSVAYPDTGNFIAFVGDVSSRLLVRRTVGTFRRLSSFPSEGAALPGSIPGVGWSDHWSFWEQGYPGVMITDTAPFRYPHYHTPQDTPDKIDFERLARVVSGLVGVARELAGPPANAKQ